MTSHRTIGIGMLGAGFIGQMHALAFGKLAAAQRQPRIEADLRVLAEPNADLAAEVADRYGWARTVDDWPAVLDDPDVELFINSGPNDLHLEPCVAAAKAGKHIFCEKPLARDADEAFQLWREVAATGVHHMCAFLHRAIPALDAARRMIAAGEIGRVRHYRSQFLLNMQHPDGHLSWRYDPAVAGHGALGDLGSHHIDAARFLVGAEVAEVTAMAETWSRDPDGRNVPVNDDWFGAACTMDNGATAVFEASRVDEAHPLTGRIEVDGTKGSIWFEMERLNELRIKEPGKGARTVTILAPDEPFADFWLPVGIQGSHSIGWIDCFAFQAHRMAMAMVENQPVGPVSATFEDGYRVAETVDAIMRAARNGRRETVTLRGI